MLKSAARKVLWATKGAALFGGAVVTLALVLGVGTAALAAAPGDPFRLGQVNAVNALTRLSGNVNNAMLRINNASTGPGATALDLQVAPGKPPMTVNSTTEVQGLNVDSLDGRNSNEFVLDTEADQIGVNGLERVLTGTTFNSESSKSVVANCSAGKVVVGTGFEVSGGAEGPSPNTEANVVVDEVRPNETNVVVVAIEEEPTALTWAVSATAICATAP